MLDYGCGRGDDSSNLPFTCYKYDPYYFPGKFRRQFSVITCIDVLNVLWRDQAEEVIENVFSWLAPGGVAYFAVRRDVKKQGFSKRGTFQCEVLSDMEIVTQNSHFCIYRLPQSNR